MFVCLLSMRLANCGWPTMVLYSILRSVLGCPCASEGCSGSFSRVQCRCIYCITLVKSSSVKAMTSHHEGIDPCLRAIAPCRCLG